MKFDGYKLGRQSIGDMTITVEIDTADFMRGMFGRWQWRRKVALFLFRLAAMFLRCRIDFKGRESP